MANLPALTPTNFVEAMQFAEALAKSTMVPPAFQRNPANILVAIQWGAELGLGPLQALQNIAVVNGRPSIYGDAMLALVRGSGLCEDVIEMTKGEGDLATAVCEARRRGSEPVVRAFSVHDAKRAGLWDKAGPWKQYPLRMLQMRARGFALRDAFPDVLRGVISAEEAADISREPKDITPQSTAALADELDAFAMEAMPVADSPPQRVSNEVSGITGGDSTRPRREPLPRQSEPDVEPDQAETDRLLAAAFVHAKDGMTTFRAWYGGLDDDQRLSLRPHIPQLRATAEQVASPAPDDPAQPSGADLSRAATLAPEVTPTRRRRRPSEPEPPEDAIARSQEALAAVLGPEEVAALDDTSLKPLPEPSVLVPFDAASNIQLWFGRARERLREMQQARLTPDRFVAYRKANAGPLLRLKSEFFSYWQNLDEIIAAGERGGAALGYVRSEASAK